MMLGIGIGSKTSTGGVVVEGNDGIIFDGKVASSVGHKATCPECKKGEGVIVAVGHRDVSLPAGPAARAGDYVACGCPANSNVLLGEGTVSVNVMGGGSSNASSVSISKQSKKITKVFFSYGAEQTKLSAISRHYSDVNVHAFTEGYSAGEMVTLEISGALKLSISGQVKANGEVLILEVFKSHKIELEGEL